MCQCWEQRGYPCGVDTGLRAVSLPHSFKSKMRDSSKFGVTVWMHTNDLIRNQNPVSSTTQPCISHHGLTFCFSAFLLWLLLSINGSKGHQSMDRFPVPPNNRMASLGTLPHWLLVSNFSSQGTEETGFVFSWSSFSVLLTHTGQGDGKHIPPVGTAPLLLPRALFAICCR